MTLIKKATARMATGIVALSLTACGLFQPKFENYEAEDGAVRIVDADSDCGKEALAIFTENVGGSIRGTCAESNCHGGGLGAQQLPLSSSEDAESDNRASLFGYTRFDRDRLEAKFKGSHTGGDQSGKITKAQVDTWLTKEEACLEQEAE